MQLCENTESRVFFHKMIGDYYRYAAESCMYPSTDFKSQCEKFVESSKVFYLEGLKMAASDLDACNPIRLSIVLNLSVFYKEISQDLPRAILITEHALSVHLGWPKSRKFIGDGESNTSLRNLWIMM